MSLVILNPSLTFVEFSGKLEILPLIPHVTGVKVQGNRCSPTRTDQQTDKAAYQVTVIANHTYCMPRCQLGTQPKHIS